MLRRCWTPHFCFWNSPSISKTHKEFSVHENFCKIHHFRFKSSFSKAISKFLLKLLKSLLLSLLKRWPTPQAFIIEVKPPPLWLEWISSLQMRQKVWRKSTNLIFYSTSKAGESKPSCAKYCTDSKCLYFIFISPLALTWANIYGSRVINLKVNQSNSLRQFPSLRRRKTASVFE